MACGFRRGAGRARLRNKTALRTALGRRRRVGARVAAHDGLDRRWCQRADRILARDRILPLVAAKVKQRNVADLSATLDRLNICFSPINRPEDLFNDPHVQRDGGLVGSINANGAPFRAPALPVEWNGESIGDGLKVPPLGADTAAVRAELDVSPDNTARRSA